MSNRIANVIPHLKSHVLGKRTISIHSYDRDKNKFKEALKRWQANSKYGLKMGRKKSDKQPNGCESSPKFNLIVV